MSSFIFFCPFCNQKIECDDSFEGKIIDCPSCKQEIVPIRSSLDETVSLVDGETLSHTENKQDVEKLKLNFTRILCDNLRFLYVAAILIIIIAGVTGVIWFCLSGQDCRKHETNQFRSARYSLVSAMENNVEKMLSVLRELKEEKNGSEISQKRSYELFTGVIPAKNFDYFENSMKDFEEELGKFNCPENCLHLKQYAAALKASSAFYAVRQRQVSLLGAQLNLIELEHFPSTLKRNGMSETEIKEGVVVLKKYMEIYEADCELLHNAINKLYQAIELLNMTR